VIQKETSNATTGTAKTTTLIPFTLVLLQCVKLVVSMANAKVLTLAHVTSDGRAMIATSALHCLVVSMEAAMVLHWLVHATTPLNGQEDFVIFLYVIVVALMDNVLHLEHASVIPAGQVPIAPHVFHLRDAVLLEVAVLIPKIQPLKLPMAVTANLITLAHCAISPSATLHAKRDKDPVCLHIATRHLQFVSASLDIKVNSALNACHIQDVQETLQLVVA